jgi:hypothetical protein
MSSNLDAIGAVQGDILYRGASAWAALPPGTSGAYLRTAGAGANPLWAGGTGTFTITPSATTTTVVDSRVLTSSVVIPRPTTANAAFDMDILYIVEGAGSFVAHHASNANANRTFKYVIY